MRRFAYVATPNVDHVVGLAAEPGAACALRQGVADAERQPHPAAPGGARADFDCRWRPARISPSALFERVIDRHEPVTIIGGDASSVDRLKRRYDLTDVRWHDPPMGLKRNPARHRARPPRSRPRSASRFTFICVGAPQQELIAYAIAQRGDARRRRPLRRRGA